MTDAHRQPENRERLLAAVTSGWISFTQQLDSLSDHDWTTQVDAQGWTAKDHVALVTAWENVVVEMFRSGSAPYETLQITESAWLAHGPASADDVIHAGTVGQALRRVKGNRDVTHARLVTILAGLPDEALTQPFSRIWTSDAAGSTGEGLIETLVGRYDRHGAAIHALISSHSMDSPKDT